MKKSLLVLLMASLFLTCALKVAICQDKPQPKKDTVNIDTDAKPTFYYAEEDKADASKSATGKIIIIAGVVIISAICGFVLLRKKKK